MKKGSHHNSQAKQKMREAWYRRRELEKGDFDDGIEVYKRSFWRRIFRK